MKVIIFIISFCFVSVFGEIFPANNISIDSITLDMPWCITEKDSILFVGGTENPTGAATGKIIQKTNTGVKEYPVEKEVRGAEFNSNGDPMFTGYGVHTIVGDSLSTIPRVTIIKDVKKASNNKIYMISGGVFQYLNNSLVDLDLPVGMNARDLTIGSDDLPWVSGSSQPFIAHQKEDGGWTIYDTASVDFRAIIERDENSFKSIYVILSRGNEVYIIGVFGLFAKLSILENTWENCWANTSTRLVSAEFDNRDSSLIWLSNDTEIMLFNLKTKTIVNRYGYQENGFPNGDPQTTFSVIHPSKINPNVIYFAMKDVIITYNRDATNLVGNGFKKSKFVKINNTYTGTNAGVEIFDIFGRTIYKTVSKKVKIGNLNLIPGVYIQKVSGVKRVFIIK